MESILQPQIPYVGAVRRNFIPGKWLTIYGVVPANACRFTVNLQCSAETGNQNDVALYIAVNLLDNNISVNSIRKGVWDEAQTVLGIPIRREERFELAITCDYTQYKISINGEHYCEFPQRVSYDRITHLAIDGDLSIEKISYETESSMPVASATSFGFKNMEAPPPSYSEAQSKLYAPTALSYGTCPQPTPGMSPYPAAGPFMPAVPPYQPYPMQPGNYPGHSNMTIPLNAASSNFRPVLPSKRKKFASFACVIFVVIMIIVVGVFNNNTRKHQHHHHHDPDWDY